MTDEKQRRREAFEFVVIGSSPVLCAAARDLARAGRSVAVFEGPYFGGAWSFDTPIDGVELESACHVLEWHRGGRALLRDLFELDFEPANPAPLRIDSKIAPYTSRKKFLVEYALHCKSLIKRMARHTVKDWGNKDSLDAIRSGFDRLSFLTFWRLPGVFSFDGIAKPVGGFPVMMRTLRQHATEAGATFLPRSVNGAARQDDSWVLEIDGGQTVTALHVVTGESTEIPGLPIDRCGLESRLHTHVVFSVPASPGMTVNHYIHLPKSPAFVRLSGTGLEHGGRQLFLAQCRGEAADRLQLNLDLVEALETCGISAQADDVTVHQVHSRTMLTRNGWGTSSKNVTPNHHVLQTVGSLTRNMIWAKPRVRELANTTECLTPTRIASPEPRSHAASRR